MNDTKGKICTEVESILVSIMDCERIESRKFPNITLWICHLEK
jgi:hypothetical protein